MSRTRRLQQHLTALGLAAGLWLAQAAPVGATPPIEGNTLDFASGFDVGTSADTVWAAALGDLDNDGDLDAVTGSGTGEDFEIIVWQNDSTPFTGGWTSSDVDNTSAPVRSVALGDLDNDGDLDLVVGTSFAGGNAEIAAWENQGVPFGGGWTGPNVVSHASSSVDSLALGDLDNDGDLDLAADDAFDISAYENDGDPFGGQWSSANLGVSADTVYDVALGDLDNDGILDVVSASEEGEDFEMIAWRNNGDPLGGLWQQTDMAAISGTPFQLAVGDLDNDGDLDATVAGDEGLRVLQNDGTPFGNAWAGLLLADSGTANRVGLADLDGDGDLDIAASRFSPHEMRAWQNDGTPFAGGWLSSLAGTPTATIRSLNLGDLDNDGDPDILATAAHTEDFEVMAFENTHVHRNAPFAAQGFAAGEPGADVLALAQADLDSDGDLDLLTAGPAGPGIEIVAWQNTGLPFAGAWPASGVGDVADTVNALAAGDLDNDGDLDLVSGSGMGAAFEIIAWEHGLDPFAGPWDSGNVGAADDAIHTLALGDLDNDGDLDIISGAGEDAFEIMVWMNDGSPFNNAWIQNGVGSTSGDVLALAVGDLDNDGDLDIISNDSPEANFEIVAWRNNGNPFAGLWNSNGLGAPNTWIYSLALGDLDNDGDLDLMSGSDSGAIVEINAWQNNGNPFGVVWPNLQMGASAGHIYDLQLGDLDDDGDLDLVTGSGAAASFEVIAWMNDGGALTGGWPLSTFGAKADDVYAVALGDLDNDGDLDVVTGSGAGDANQIMAWKNIGGSAGLIPRLDLPEAAILNGNEDSVMRLLFAHNGRAGDDGLELSYLNLGFMRADCATPLNDAEANAVVDNLRLRLDDGDLVFETTDTLVADVGALALASGVQTVALANGDANAQVAVGGGKTYWVSLLTTADATGQNPNSLCLVFDPDADALVEAKGAADYSVSIQDTDATAHGPVLIALTVHLPLVVN
jgi:hypothetical protein